MVTRQSTATVSVRKTGEGEFFHMTYLANILPHPQRNKLIQLFGNQHYEKLYSQAQRMGLPFYKWNEWIKAQLDDAVAQHKL